MDTSDESGWIRYSSLFTFCCSAALYGLVLDHAKLQMLSGVNAGRLELVLAAIAFFIALPMSPFTRFTMVAFAVAYGGFVTILGGAFDVLKPMFSDWIFERSLIVNWHYANLGRVAGPWVGLTVYIVTANRRYHPAGARSIWAAIAQDPTLAILASVCSILGFSVGTWSDVLSHL